MTADELAAVIAALDAFDETAQRPADGMNAWRLAALLPDLTLEDVRAAAQGSTSVS